MSACCVLLTKSLASTVSTSSTSRYPTKACSKTVEQCSTTAVEPARRAWSSTSFCSPKQHIRPEASSHLVSVGLWPIVQGYNNQRTYTT